MHLFVLLNHRWCNNYLCKMNLYGYFTKLGKLQIRPLKFVSAWISCPDISKFGFYHLKFGGVWISYLDILEFEFDPINFRGVCKLYQ